MKRIAIVGLLALAACTPTPNTTKTTSSSPSPKASAGTTATSSTAPAAATGTSTVKVTVKGKEAIVDPTVKFSPTDLIGKRMRLGVTAGEENPMAMGHANVTFLFGAGGKTMIPGWDMEAPEDVFSIQVFYLDPDTKTGKTYDLSTKEDGTTREAKDMHIKGHISKMAFPNPGSSQVAVEREAVTLDFDLVQPEMKP